MLMVFPHMTALSAGISAGESSATCEPLGSLHRNGNFCKVAWVMALIETLVRKGYHNRTETGKGFNLQRLLRRRTVPRFVS
jgi:hypothetical protein